MAVEIHVLSYNMHKGFSTLPMVLETPKGEDDEFTMDLRNLAALRKLIA